MRRRRSGVTSNAERSEISGQAVPSIDRPRRDDREAVRDQEVDAARGP
jgi:hypothetical protein